MKFFVGLGLSALLCTLLCTDLALAGGSTENGGDSIEVEFKEIALQIVEQMAGGGVISRSLGVQTVLDAQVSSVSRLSLECVPTSESDAESIFVACQGSSENLVIEILSDSWAWSLEADKQVWVSEFLYRYFTKKPTLSLIHASADLPESSWRELNCSQITQEDLRMGEQQFRRIFDQFIMRNMGLRFMGWLAKVGINWKEAIQWVRDPYLVKMVNQPIYIDSNPNQRTAKNCPREGHCSQLGPLVTADYCRWKTLATPRARELFVVHEIWPSIVKNREFVSDLNYKHSAKYLVLVEEMKRVPQSDLRDSFLGENTAKAGYSR